MKTSLIPTMLLGVLAATACSRETEPAMQVPAEVAAAVQAAPPVTTAAEPLDVCALLSRSDAESVIGALTAEPEADTPNGSLLGGCSYRGASAPLNVSARPAREFDATVRFAGKKAPVQPVAGLGEKAFQTQYGLLIQPAGKAYFLVVLVMKSGKQDDTVSVSVARKLKL